MSDIQNPEPDFSGSGPVEYISAEVDSRGKFKQVLASEEARLFAIPGVTSVGVGLDPTGSEAIVVGVMDVSVLARLPRAIQGVPVIATVTGLVEALKKW